MTHCVYEYWKVHVVCLCYVSVFECVCVCVQYECVFNLTLEI